MHDLVAAAFLGSRPGGAWVHHIDGTRDNNQVSNLEYIDAHKHKVMSTQGARSSSAKLTEQDVREIRRMYAAGAFSYDVLGDLYGVHPSNIHLIVHRCTWKYLE
uniref:Putative homing endonuclease n=1 Tax=viral metagenome TaxID=1070528 RepID=A0A6M3J4A2_9ZZZZ